MKLYCYYFRTNGTVEKEVIKCRKNKGDYAFNSYGIAGSYVNHVDFDDVGKVICGTSENNDSLGCRVYLLEDVEITSDMKHFAERRAERIAEMREERKRFYDEIENMCINASKIFFKKD